MKEFMFVCGCITSIILTIIFSDCAVKTAELNTNVEIQRAKQLEGKVRTEVFRKCVVAEQSAPRNFSECLYILE